MGGQRKPNLQCSMPWLIIELLKTRIHLMIPYILSPYLRLTSHGRSGQVTDSSSNPHNSTMYTIVYYSTSDMKSLFSPSTTCIAHHMTSLKFDRSVFPEPWCTMHCTSCWSKCVSRLSASEESSSSATALCFHFRFHLRHAISKSDPRRACPEGCCPRGVGNWRSSIKD